MERNDFEAGLGLGFERGILGRRVAVTFSGGFSGKRGTNIYAQRAYATLRRFPVRLGLFVPLLVGPVWLEPGIRVAVDWLFISRSSQIANDNISFFQTSWGGEVVLAVRVALMKRLFARLGVSGGAAVPYDVRTPDAGPTSQRVFGQPRFYAKSGLELGFSFQ